MTNKTFTGKIYFEVKCYELSYVNFPGSKQTLVTGEAAKIKRTIVGHPIQIGLLSNGQGDQMLPLNKQFLKKICKQLGGSVTIFIKDVV